MNSPHPATLPPHSEENETGVLGSCLLDSGALAVAIREGVTGADFYMPVHRTIWTAIASMHAKSEPVSVLTVSARLRELGQLEECGGAAFLDSLIDAVPTATHCGYHVQELLVLSRRRRMADAARAMVEVAESGGDTSEVLAAMVAAQESRCTTGLPSIVNGQTFTTTAMPEPSQVITGVLHRGSKAVYGGPSKAFKTWSLLDLCLAVSTGGRWFGFDTTPGRVLYVNFELQPFAVHKRLTAIAEDRQCEIPSDLHIWNLRGFARPLSQLLPELMRQVQGEGYSLIVPDPIYKTLAGRDENAAGDIGELCGELDALAVTTGAAVAFGAHFAKGNASGKEHIDRVSGSGVWARDPDAIITATTHEEESAFTLEMTLRNFPPVAPFVIRWEYPRMRRDDAADPMRLKQVKGGRVEEYGVETITKYLTEPLTPGAWLKVCGDECGISRKTFYRRVADAQGQGVIERTGNLWQRRIAPGFPSERTA